MIKGENFNIPVYKPRVLVAPLDWGLGHATRCIPIISALIQQNCFVIVAAEGRVKLLLQKEFPDLEFVQLAGYRVRYSRYKWLMPVVLLTQLPKIINRIYSENRWLKKFIMESQVDAVISDNRLGLYHNKISCIYITHQLTIITGNRFTERLAQKIHYYFINKFRSCWVPDLESGITLAGRLSHPVILPAVPVTYLGALSRFKITGNECIYDLCVILSGPEPQRTIFEKIILRDIHNTEGKICIVRGLPGENEVLKTENASVKIFNHLPADELNRVMLQSKLIISRSGYSTVMDLFKLQKKAILVATPAQTEQEYLAKYLSENGMFCSVEQHTFNLTQAISQAESAGSGLRPEWKENHQNAVATLVKSIRAGSEGI